MINKARPGEKTQSGSCEYTLMGESNVPRFIANKVTPGKHMLLKSENVAPK